MLLIDVSGLRSQKTEFLKLATSRLLLENDPPLDRCDCSSMVHCKPGNVHV